MTAGGLATAEKSTRLGPGQSPTARSSRHRHPRHRPLPGEPIDGCGEVGYKNREGESDASASDDCAIITCDGPHVPRLDLATAIAVPAEEDLSAANDIGALIDLFAPWQESPASVGRYALSAAVEDAWMDGESYQAVDRLWRSWLRRSVSLAVVIVSLVAGSVAASEADAASGDLDPTFSGDGFAVASFGELEASGNVLGEPHVDAVAVGPAGEVVVAASLRYNPRFSHTDSSWDYFGPAVARFDASGAPDPAFASDGVVELGTTPETEAFADAAVSDIAIQPDGKIVLAGTDRRGSLWVGRLTADGSPDVSFGAGGAVVAARPAVPLEGAVAVEVSSDGRIVIAGRVYVKSTAPGTAPEWYEPYVARLLPNGAFDPSFDGDGWRVEELGPRGMGAHDMDVAPDGSIAVYATVRGLSYLRARAAILRYEASGALDSSFADGGIALLELGRVWSTGAVTFDSAGRVLLSARGRPRKRRVAGGLVRTSLGRVQLFRLLPDGRLDEGFGDGGRARATKPSGIDPYEGSGAVNLAADSASRPYLASHYLLGRLTDAGEMDTSFGDGGWTTRPYVRQENRVAQMYATSLALGDGAVVAAGTVRLAEVVVARHRLDDGSSDADADGWLDRRERCPLVYGKCPRYPRQLSLHRSRDDESTLRGRVDPDGFNIGCEDGQRIELVQRRRGRVRRVAATETIEGHAGEFAFRDVRATGPLYAIARPHLLDHGICLRARSETLIAP